MLRIYISSTFQDLEPERRAARDAIEGLGHYAAGMEGYPASDERPLNYCLEDVRKCQAYVGVIAWKYGYRPKSGGKSITQLEYEEARAQGLPCYIFLLKETASWPRAFVPDEDQRDVKGFREQLQLDHVIGWFTDPESLALAVTKSLAMAFGSRESGPPVPDILPYLCDRSDQEFALRKAILAAQDEPGRPLLCIVHGKESEAHDRFLERLHLIMLPTLLGLERQNQSIHLIHLEWPPGYRDTAEFHQRLEWSLLKEVVEPPKGSSEEINSALQKRVVPVAIHCYLSTDTWKTNAINDFVEFWSRWPELGVGQTLVVLLFVTYKEKKNLTPERLQQINSRNGAIRQFLVNFDFQGLSALNGTVLPELLGPTEDEATTWARGDEAKRFCDSDELVNRIGEFYEEWEARQAGKFPPRNANSEPAAGNGVNGTPDLDAEPVRIPTSHLAPKLREFISLTLVPEGRV